MQRFLFPFLVLLAVAIADLWTASAASSVIGAAGASHPASEGASTAVGLRAWPHWPLALRISAALVFALAWRLRRGRIAWAVVGLLAVAELPRAGTLLPDLQPETLASLVFVAAVALPLHLALAALWTEFWVASTAGAVRFAVLAAELAAAAFLASAGGAGYLEAARALDRSGADAGMVVSALGAISASAPLPAASMLAYLASALIIATVFYFRQTALEAGLLVALLASAVAFAVGGAADLYLGTASVVLGLALVENAFRLAFHDGLTGLPARRALEERLQQMGRTYALAMLDLDHFKQFNDKHGHEVGDQILRLVASRLARVTGGGEAFRYGGEEFTVLFPGRTAGEAKAHMDALREDIAGRKFTVRSPGRPKKKPQQKAVLERLRKNAVTKQLGVTVSIGVAERSEKLASAEEVMKAADQALYKSKKAGRNRVTVAGRR